MAFRRMVLSEAIPITTTAWVSPRLNPSVEARFGAAAKTVAPTLQASTAFRRSEGDAWSLLANGVCRWRRRLTQEHPHPNPLPQAGEGAVLSGLEVRHHPSPSPLSRTLGQAFQADSGFTTHAERPPLPPGEGWGEGTEATEYTAVARRFASKLAPTLTIPANAGIDRHFRLTLDSPLTPNGPLSLRERAGVRERSQPNTPQPQGSTLREQARSYLHHSRERRDRQAFQADSGFTTHAERLPLPPGEGWGEGTTDTPQPPGGSRASSLLHSHHHCDVPAAGNTR